MMAYGVDSVGPLETGVILDALGGETVLNRGIGFARPAVIMRVEPAAFAVLKPGDLSGDRASR